MARTKKIYPAQVCDTCSSTFTTQTCVKCAKTIAQKAWKERKKIQGICTQCKTPCAPYLTCEKHRRHKTERRHITGESKTYKLGSKLSPFRAGYTLKIIKASNPILTKHWKTISSWIEANFELWSEHYDSVMFNYIPLKMVGLSKDIDRDEWKLRAYYSKLRSGITLEDFVIAKVDHERGNDISSYYM